jgi:hypothetical protein
MTFTHRAAADASARAMLRQAAWRIAPVVMAERAARYERSLRASWRLPEAADAFMKENGDRVYSGPFAGLRYWRGGDSPMAKLAGSYELEIAPWIAEALAVRPPVFVDLGAADGYYAVGVKVVQPGARVIAFELASTARRELRRLADLNGVQIEIRRRASARAVSRLPLSRALVLCDIEGAEAGVLSTRLVRRLETATVIVELHEHARPGIAELLADRFRRTHALNFVCSQPRDGAFDEHRVASMRWARFTPRGAA